MRCGYNVRVWRSAEYGYFFASSPLNSHLTTQCGHKHASYEEAEKCIPAVELEYRKKRWPGRCQWQLTLDGCYLVHGSKPVRCGKPCQVPLIYCAHHAEEHKKRYPLLPQRYA